MTERHERTEPMEDLLRAALAARANSVTAQHLGPLGPPVGTPTSSPHRWLTIAAPVTVFLATAAALAAVALTGAPDTYNGSAQHRGTSPTVGVTAFDEPRGPVDPAAPAAGASAPAPAPTPTRPASRPPSSRSTLSSPASKPAGTSSAKTSSAPANTPSTSPTRVPTATASSTATATCAAPSSSAKPTAGNPSAIPFATSSPGRAEGADGRSRCVVAGPGPTGFESPRP